MRNVGGISRVEGNCWISGQIEWARAAGTRPLHDVEVNHGRFDAGVAHEILDGADVGAHGMSDGGTHATNIRWPLNSASGELRKFEKSVPPTLNLSPKAVFLTPSDTLLAGRCGGMRDR